MNDDKEYRYITLPAYMLEPYKPLGPRAYWQLVWMAGNAAISCALAPSLEIIPESGFREESRWSGRYYAELWL